MATKSLSVFANVVGLISVVLLCLIWGVVLDPFKWHPQFPGGLRGGAAAMFIAVVMSILASVWGKRFWLVAAVWALFTFIYVGFFYRLPLWY